MEKTFNRGDQVAYVPDHAKGDLEHKDIEFGFVTSGPGVSLKHPNEPFYFCRFWRKGTKRGEPVLRTTLNSEFTNAKHLQPYPFTIQENVIAALEDYC